MKFQERPPKNIPFFNFALVEEEVEEGRWGLGQVVKEKIHRYKYCMIIAMCWVTRGVLVLKDISPCFMLQMLPYWRVLFNLCLWNAPSSLMQFSRVLIIFDLKFILRSASLSHKVGQSLATPWWYAENSRTENWELRLDDIYAENSNPSRHPFLLANSMQWMEEIFDCLFWFWNNACR